MNLKHRLIAPIAAVLAAFGQLAFSTAADETRKNAALNSSAAFSDAVGPLDLPLDESVKIRLEPSVQGIVVNRIVAPSKITVVATNCSRVEIFVVPVDAPYGGKALEQPHAVGFDDEPANGFQVTWSKQETAPYVKVFAVVDRKTGFPRRFRSHSLDFGMGGKRLAPQASK